MDSEQRKQVHDLLRSIHIDGVAEPTTGSAIEELFFAALEQSPETRARFLDSACGERTELRRQVDALLEEHVLAGSFLEKPVVADLAILPNDITMPEMAMGHSSLVGRQIGPYRILSLLGAGGMGEVYRAYDDKLGRDVAIKVLPAAFAQNADRLARFHREARTLASLNHPNIAAIYGLEMSDTVACLILELVEGDMLRGPLPLATALERAGQVAEALEAAHEHGIIHRDLKPGNVKVTLRGRVKVLDFGLAKAIRENEEAPTGPHLAAHNAVETMVGHIVGTPSYMSPEQASGQAVDQRTDIWAFGCLLYELLAGKRVFRGSSLADTLKAVRESEPDWQALPGATPAKIRDLLRRCLEKDPNRRLADIGDAARTITEAQRGWNQWKTVAAAVALGGLALLGAGSVLWWRSAHRLPGRADWVQLTQFPDPVSQPALSPDGRELAFMRGPLTTVGLGQIYVKTLPNGETGQLTGDNLKKSDPAFSPDGKQIAYTAVGSQFDWATWVVSMSGGEPRRWLNNATGLTWGTPGQILFSEKRVRYPSGIVAANDDGTNQRDVYFPQNERANARRARLSPDGKSVLIAEISAYGNWDRCRVVPMDGSSPGRQVGPPGAACSFVAWSTDGKWMYFTSKAGGLNHIWRERFSGGSPQQFTSGITEEEGIAMAPDGRSLVTGVALESTTLWMHDTRGERQISVLEGNAADAKFSANGKSLFYRVLKATQRCCALRDPGELWVTDLSSGHARHVAPELHPLEYDLSRDGQLVVMTVADNEGKPRLWLAPVNRSAAPRQIPNVEGQNAIFGPGGQILFRRLEGTSAFVYRVWPDGTGLSKALDQPVVYVDSISPDGRWIEIWGPVAGNRNSSFVQLVPLGKGLPVLLGSNILRWSGSGDSVWISRGAVPDGRTYIVPLPHGEALPQIPAGGFQSEEEVAALPGARQLDAEGAPGPALNTYAFERHTAQRNLYRIPIP